MRKKWFNYSDSMKRFMANVAYLTILIAMLTLLSIPFSSGWDKSLSVVAILFVTFQFYLYKIEEDKKDFDKIINETSIELCDSCPRRIFLRKGLKDKQTEDRTSHQ
jgi:hypothetical protein